ncbi:MAG: UDP-N-acetylglucosamine 2-epimerase (non-hydrolyzing), partial [Chlorobi bacterium]|nr:UDP-N-acetylglucosamine 2-epimerase (non-hydrolyzing) [Chlorobiota bacterium]
MLKIITIIGARPQIIKAAALSRAIRNYFKNDIREIIVHTGQHYDREMSQVFISEMGIPEPDYNLEIGSASHGVQTAEMIKSIEEVLFREKPDYLVVYGDTNSTLAGAVAASKLHIPVVHVEAGLRSFNKSMPEEINRILCDHASTLLFTPTRTGYNNLLKEGFNPDNKPPFTADNPGIFHCGDVMFDNTLYFKEIALRKSNIIEKLGLEDKHFVLATIHRDNNTDQPERLNAIFGAINQLAAAEKTDFILPLHPRTQKALKENLDPGLRNQMDQNSHLRIIPPVSFFDIINLENGCEMIFTDSGGLQKESWFFEKPCVILRPETEWIEIVEAGCGKVVDADKERIK